ncbi:hypothetical protein HGRIS_007037 [Hohenbuehelia grisea]|uniref:Potassium transport protein n=1 Tax=Hohenbuehelia grisea TaxID=104357 RepID=A0ABR3JB52_9AGAR
MAIGDITIVSWIMVLVRKYYFRNKCEYVASFRKPRKKRNALMVPISEPTNMHLQREVIPANGAASTPNVEITHPTPNPTMIGASPLTEEPSRLSNSSNRTANDGDAHFLSDRQTITSSPRDELASLPPASPVVSSPRPMSGDFPRVVSFQSFQSPEQQFGHPRGIHRMHRRRGLSIMPPHSQANLPPLPSSDTGAPLYSAKYRDNGGFPGPITLAHRIAQRAAPNAYRNLQRKLTLPLSVTLVSGPPANTEATTGPQGFWRQMKKASWLNFDGLVVGRNSDFHTETLSDEQVEEIGGVEYRALRLLSYFVPFYFVLTQLFAYILFAPWLSSTTRYDGVFDAQPRLVQKPWFSLFQVMGAYTGGGLSLVDTGMVPFQSAYLMVFAIMFVILAGNHALTTFYLVLCVYVVMRRVSLRFFIWIGYRFLPLDRDDHEALEFLLDHPRRCFVYMSVLLVARVVTSELKGCEDIRPHFPPFDPHISFSAIEWVTFEVLNLGLPDYESLSIGVRTVVGLFQGLAARASGFSIVPIANFAPAMQFLYLVMMYIAIYPIALSIRATNVYEERSLGVFEAEPEDEDEEPQGLEELAPRQRVGRYLGWHLRRQMSVDIWWLVWAVFIIAIIERHNIMDEDKKWFDLFRVLFELVSAFGGIGLSLGVPYDNFAFAGGMRPLSKLVIIVIMVRGRHRGLPVAVDRAVLLPHELNRQKGATSTKTEKSEQPHPTAAANGGVGIAV